MKTDVLIFDLVGRVIEPGAHGDGGDAAGPATVVDTWRWIDVTREGDANESPPAMLDALRLDPLAVHDAFNDLDLPKYDDFGDHVAIILHGLNDADRISTYELDCFVTAGALVTVHQGTSRAVDALWRSILTHPELAVGGPSEVLARLADGLNRRMLSVVEAFDQHAEELMNRALSADRFLLNDVAAVRADLAAIRRVTHPQREALDLARSSDSALVTDGARRRLADVVDVGTRTLSGLDGARSLLSDTIETYRGAEARSATEITKVLTIYAALLLPLSLVVGFFGMNHTNLPTIDRPWGWAAVTAAMVAVVALSLGVFVSQGWIQRPSGKTAGEALGRGLAEAARAPAQVASAVFTMTTLPFGSGKPAARRSADDWFD